MAIRSRMAGRHVLVVEDEFFIADDLRTVLAKAGADVVGPVPDAQQALRLVAERRVDLAVLDINLKGEKIFAVADALKARDIPFVFATGYDPAVVPERFHGVRRWQKPFNMAQLVASLPLQSPARDTAFR